MKTPQTACDQKRRSFLKLSGLLGLGAASAALLPVEKVESLLLNRNEYKVSKTRLAMGTFVDMTAIHHSRDQAEEAIGKAFAEVDRLCALLTRFGNSSPIVELNTNRQLAQPATEITELIGRSLYFNRDTNGAFDITVKPLIDLYQSRFAAGVTPSENEIAEMLALIGAERLQFKNKTVEMPLSGMAITLDGMAPGYIADRAADILSQNGISNHLVNAGGEIRVGGAAAQGKPWVVAIQDPKKSKEFPDVIELREGAIATSGNYEVFYDRDKLFHHIVNSKTGHSPQQSASVTVMAPTALDADILSTAIYVMEPEAGLRYINSRPGYECFIVDAQGRGLKSNGWPA